jgi:MATE family multidrug resistance protein
MLQLALPVVLTYLGIMAMGVEDLIFVGRISPEAMGAVGVGASAFTWVLMFGIGILSGLDFLIAHAFGSSRRDQCHEAWAQGLIVSVGVGIPGGLLIYLLGYGLAPFGIQADVAVLCAAYLKIIALSLLPTLIFTATRQYLQALGVALPAMIILLVSNLFNICANYALVLGHWGFAPMGSTGSAWATLAARIFMMILMVAYVYHWDRKNELHFKHLGFGVRIAQMKELLRLGIPAAFQMIFEVGVFSLSSALAAKLTTQALAAHQIALNTASIAFMVPLGISSATAVLVGQHMGKLDYRGAAQMGWKGMQLGVGFMACSCVALLVFSRPILLVYTHDEAVLELAKNVLLVVALFQLADGAQTVATGALRGVADTRTPMFANLIGHWLIGLPLGIYLCFYHRLGPGLGLVGLWIGLATGLVIVAVSLSLKWAYFARAHFKS